MSNNKLPPLKHVDKDLNLGFSEKVELSSKKCEHDLYLKETGVVMCKKCGAGYMGPRVHLLLKETKEENSP